ncbi:MAG TPA: hypothetical protein VNW51_07970, partial [Mucilaginibacter sp.]|jgi:hypothetical protein|nr:hypothetical protein [Mucilaginibacter sp.]
MLDYYFLAFVDLLGYSDMVKNDQEGPATNRKYFDKLITLFNETAQITHLDIEFTVTQFSDSVIFASPLDYTKFDAFCELISSYQYRLFCNEILSRGGISYGKHYNANGFLYSSALIEAYSLESKFAKYPRVVVSKDLIDLVDPQKNNRFAYLIRDNDFYIIDYLRENTFSDNTPAYINSLLERMVKNPNPSIQEKGEWLKAYIAHKHPDSGVTFNKFS